MADTDTLTPPAPGDVQGHATYLELRRIGSTSRQTIATIQMIVFSGGKTSSGAEVLPCVYRRRLTEAKSRSQWRTTDGAGTAAVDTDDWVGSAVRLLYPTYSYINAVSNSEFRLYGQPIVVEVLPSDLDDVVHHKTPYKVLARINKSRLQAGMVIQPADFESIVHPFVSPFAPASPGTT